MEEEERVGKNCCCWRGDQDEEAWVSEGAGEEEVEVKWW